MSELEQLTLKSREDLAAIAVQFGDFTAEEAQTKTKEELIAAITRTPVETPAPKKSTKKSTAKTKTEKSSTKTASKKKATKEDSVETPSEPVKAETKKKTTSKSKKTEAKVEEVKEEVKVEEPVAPVVAEEEKPAKKTRKTKKAKAQEEPAEVKPDVESKEEPAQPVEEKPVEEKPASKTTKRSRKKKTTEEKVEEKNAEIVEEKTEEKTEEATEVKAEASEVKTEAPKGRSRNSRKRRLSFGPSQEIKEVAIPEGEESTQTSTETTDGAVAPEETPKQPEIVYTEIEGILSIGGQDNKNEFCGFVHKTNYLPGEEDAYVPGQIIKRMGLRRGDKIKGLVAPPKGKDKYAPLRKVLAVNDIEIPEDSDFEITRKRPRFESLTAVYPDERLTLETGAENLSSRIIDLFCPIGKGQRGMIVSPPKAGKTVLLKRVANSITTNNPDCKVIVLLIDERPEEVTDMQRSIKGEVVYSTFDKRPENHVRVTELVLERAMRLVELGQDVVILLDSMTRLGRAYNLTVAPSGRTLSGGLDPASLYGPKRFFGAARNIENGGSLTIIATALIETGSKMDEVIFEEFKGTGNMEVVLDRKLADRRVYPAIAVDKSGTRREDLLLTPEELEAVWLTRKAIADVDTIAATEAVINFMKRTTSNSSFVLSAKKSFSVD